MINYRNNIKNSIKNMKVSVKVIILDSARFLIAKENMILMQYNMFAMYVKIKYVKIVMLNNIKVNV